MSFVIPKWTAHAVRDWDELLVKTDKGTTELNEATAVLLNYMPLIGITKLNNADDAWRRIAIFQALFGCVISNKTKKLPMFITKSDVDRHIGIETEGKQLTFGEFCLDINTRKLEGDETQHRQIGHRLTDEPA